MQKKVEEIVRSVVITKVNELIDWLKENGATQDDLNNLVISAGAVTGVFGRRGNVKAQKGDYTAKMVGAAAEKHALEHEHGGKDPIDPLKIGAAPNEHAHGNISREGKIGETNGKIIMTGVGGALEAKEKEESGFVIKPVVVGTSDGEANFTAENNREYEYINISSLVMVGADVDCHGIIVFSADSAPSISVTEFKAISGDDIAEAVAGETWEFDVFNGRILWKNWGVESGT